MTSDSSPRVALVLAFVAGLAMSGAPLVHGYAHEIAAHESDDHGEHRSRSPVGVDASVVSPQDHGDDHPHPQIGRAVTTRLELSPPPMEVPRSAVAIDFRDIARSPAIVAAALPRADPVTERLLRSRAPPIG